MCKMACSTLNTIPGVKAEEMSTDRIAVKISLSNPHIDFDRIRQHPLIKRDGVEKLPGQRGTVCLDECTTTMHLGSYYPEDVVHLVHAARVTVPV